LRNCIRSGTRTSAKHVDCSAFWKQEYERVELAQSGLLDKLHDLEQENAELLRRLHVSNQDSAQAGIERKRSTLAASTGIRQAPTPKAETTISGKSGVNKAEIATAVEQVADLSSCMSLSCIGPLTHGNAGSTTFMRTFFALRQCLRAKEFDRVAASASLRASCKAADEMLSRSIEASFLQPTNTKKDIQTAKTALTNLLRTAPGLQLCYPTFLQVVENISNKINTGELALHSVVRFFQQILGHLHAVSATRSGESTACGKRNSQSRPRGTKQNHFSGSDFDEACTVLARLAVHFMKELDPSKLVHEKLLEGLACVFLDHLGSSLSLVVFADISDAGLGARSLGVLPPRGLLDTAEVGSRVAMSTATYEAGYLIPILEQLMLLMGNQQSTAADSSHFAAKIRDKLQSTFLRGVFGTDDETFKDALASRLGEEPDGGVEVASGEKAGRSEWVVGEVWRLLGWDILGGPRSG
jgi:hypothetical protein